MQFLDEISQKPERPFVVYYWKSFFAFLPIGLFLIIMTLLGYSIPTIDGRDATIIEGVLLELILIILTPLVVSIFIWVNFTIGNLNIRIVNFLIKTLN